MSLLGACGGSASDRSGLDPGDEPDAGDVPDAGIPDAQPSPDAGLTPDAASGGTVIDSVAVDGAFTQVRQGSEFEVVITGSGLEEFTSVTIADAALDARSLVVTATEVRGGFFMAHGAAPGPRGVTLAGAEGAVIAADALQVTPWVVEADAVPDGRGTYESPMHICDVRVSDAVTGDQVVLGAGEHVCAGAPLLGSGVEVSGEGVDITTLQAPGFSFVADTTSALTSFRDLTLVSDDPAAAVELRVAGPRAVRDVRLVGLGIDLGMTAAAAIAERVEISGCSTGIWIVEGQLTASDVIVEGCEIGLRVGTVATPEDEFLEVTVSGGEFSDNRTGIFHADGTMSVTDTVVRDVEATPAAAEVGILVWSGDLTLSGVEITGHDRIGISAISGGDGPDADALLDVDGLLIEGGQQGIEIIGNGDGVSVAMRSAIVRDQTVAAFSFRGSENTHFVFDDVALSVVSGFALEDLREDPFFLWEVNVATATTLNGRSYEGQLITGPISTPPDLRIVHPRAGVQF